VTDIATGWTELAPLLVREPTLLVRRRLPFPLLGFDVDNDTVFMNETVRAYGAAEYIELTRCRPYRKNDQTHVEQKNGEIVRRMVGDRRCEGIAAAEPLAKLYAPVRLFVNAFQPSLKLAQKTREGARVVKRYHKPLTPCDRLLEDARVAEGVRQRVMALRADLDPVRLLADIRSARQALVTLADAALSPSCASSAEMTVPIASSSPDCTPRGGSRCATCIAPKTLNQTQSCPHNRRRSYLAFVWAIEMALFCLNVEFPVNRWRWPGSAEV
jgi:hypothetical protein